MGNNLFILKVLIFDYLKFLKQDMSVDDIN